MSWLMPIMLRGGWACAVGIALATQYVAAPTVTSAARIRTDFAVFGKGLGNSSVASAGVPNEVAQDSYTTDAITRICRVTAYCDQGLTAAGTLADEGQCAAPEDIPFGTEVYVPALRRTFVVTDRTHKRFRHNTVDIFIPVESKCFRFGRQYLECHFKLPETSWERPRNPRSFTLSRPVQRPQASI